MKNKFTKLLLAFTIFVCIMGFKNTYATELEVKETTKEYKEWLLLPEEKRENTIEPRKYLIEIEQTNIEKIRSIAGLRLMGDNSSFDLREKISIKLKNQMQTSQCWAFAMTTALETNVALNQKKSVEYSPRHMDYATSKTFLDGTNPLGFNREVGNFILGRWRKSLYGNSIFNEWNRSCIRRRHAICKFGRKDKPIRNRGEGGTIKNK